jgi:hypothetical protein
MLSGKLTAAKITKLIAKCAKEQIKRKVVADGAGLCVQITNYGAGASWIFRFPNPTTGEPDVMGIGVVL